VGAEDLVEDRDALAPAVGARLGLVAQRLIARAGRLLDEPFDQREDDGVLGGEVEVERRARDAGCLEVAPLSLDEVRDAETGVSRDSNPVAGRQLPLSTIRSLVTIGE
jgi:hypothetical protein